jgi:hypothetical protein
MDLLEQLVFNGVATKKYSKLDDKLEFTLRTLKGGEQLDIEKDMRDIEGTPSFIVHSYSLKMLSRCLLQYQSNNFKDKSPEEVQEFLETLSTQILDLLIDTNSEFQAECQKLVKPENLENLSQTPSLEEESKSELTGE